MKYRRTSLSTLILLTPSGVLAQAATPDSGDTAWILASTAYQVLILETPRAEIMGVVAFAALAANLISVLLLLRYRNGDSNVRSVWLCSRNDAIGNVAVLGAAAAVWASGSAWPDLVVAALMASLFLHGSFRIIRQARSELALHPA